MIITKDNAMIPENEWEKGYVEGYADSARSSYYAWEMNKHRWHNAKKENPADCHEVWVCFSKTSGLYPFKHYYGVGFYIQEDDAWYIQGCTKGVIVHGWKEIERFEIDE